MRQTETLVVAVILSSHSDSEQCLESYLLLVLSDLAAILQESGWKLPAYRLPYTSNRNPDGPWVTRVVTRQDVSADKLQIFLQDISSAIGQLESTSLEDIDELTTRRRGRYSLRGSGDYL